MQKSIEKVCALLGLTAMPVKYKHAAAGVHSRRKGWDLVNDKGYIIAELEPSEGYYKETKWVLKISQCEVYINAQPVQVCKSEFLYLRSLRELRAKLAHFEGMPINDYYTTSIRGDHPHNIELKRQGKIIG